MPTGCSRSTRVTVMPWCHFIVGSNLIVKKFCYRQQIVLSVNALEQYLKVVSELQRQAVDGQLVVLIETDVI
jgi:hypothetical protein